ncbi:hypothetical protein SprV_0200867200 [Sparganum proliferum]
MKDTRLPKQLFYDDVATGVHRRGGPRRHYMDAFKNSLKRLYISPEIWEDLAKKRLAWRRKVKTGAAIYEANQIAAAKSQREARKSQVPCLICSSHPPPPTCLLCQRAFRVRIVLLGHIRTQYAINPIMCISSPTLAPAANPTPTATLVTADRIVATPPPPSAEPICPAPSPASTAAAGTTTSSGIPPPPPHRWDDVPSTSNNIKIPSSSDVDSVHTCPHEDRTFTSHIGLVRHLRIHHTDTGEPVPGAPTFTHCIHLSRPHCAHTFVHRMGLLGHMRIHENLR